jgi:glycosyltransferase involved in cell wall biosynthesis
MDISLCMIVKNEARFLADSLTSAKDVLGLTDLVVVDTGSTDRTKQIAAENGARVFDFAWVDDFSAARNYAAGFALYDWVFALDADEKLLQADKLKLKDFLSNPYNIGTPTFVDEDAEAYYQISRLYNKNHYHFEGIIHEQIRPLTQSPHAYALIPVKLIHYGYNFDIVTTKGKHERNIGLLQKALAKQPDDPYLLFQMGKQYFYKRNNLAKACVYFEKSLSLQTTTNIKNQPYVYTVVESHGYALINSGQAQKALRLVNQYADYYRDNPFFRFLTAHVYQENGLLVEAVECYQSCLGEDALDYKGITSFLSYYNIGVILECIGMTDDAKQMYVQCGDYPPAVARLKAMQ